MGMGGLWRHALRPGAADGPQRWLPPVRAGDLFCTGEIADMLENRMSRPAVAAEGSGAEAGVVPLCGSGRGKGLITARLKSLCDNWSCSGGL